MDANLEALLNQLGEAERAGGRVLHELIEQAESLDLKELLKKVEHDEGYFAGPSRSARAPAERQSVQSDRRFR
jgi:hypothetical protein